MLQIKNRFTGELILEIENLRNADLIGADLIGADLIGADLIDVNLPIYCKWRVSYNTNGLIKIGCKVKSIEEWDLFFDSTETFNTKRDTEEFKRIQANYEAVKSYVSFMSKKD